MTRDCLPGVSRAAVLRLAASAGRRARVRECDLTLDDAREAAECFATSTSFCLCPVASIDGEAAAASQAPPPPSVGGTVTSLLYGAYIEDIELGDFVAQYLAHLPSEEWNMRSSAGSALLFFRSWRGAWWQLSWWRARLRLGLPGR